MELTSSKGRLVEIVGLFMITGVATWTRLYNLGGWSFWLDEALTVSDSLHLFTQIQPWNALHFRPLNFWMTGLVFSFLPVSEFTARLAPCVIGILTVPLVYVLSRRFLGRSTALLATLFLSLSTWHIYWSQNARGYTLLLAFSLVSVAMFYAGVERGSRLALLGSLVSLLVAYLAHPVALFLLAAYCVFLALIPVCGCTRPSGYRYQVLWVFWAPVIGVLPLAFPGITGLIRGVLNLPQGASPFYVLASLAYYVQLPFLILGMFGVALLIYRKNMVGLYLATLMGVPLLGLLVLSSIRGGSALYVFHTLPFYFMGAAVVVSELLKILNGRGAWVGIAVVVALLGAQASQAFGYFTYQWGDRPRWEEAVAYVASKKERGDLVASSVAPVLEYYLGSTSMELREPDHTLWLSKRDGKIEQLSGRLWLLLRGDLIGSKQGGVYSQEWLTAHCELSRLFEAWTAAKNRSVLVYRCVP